MRITEDQVQAAYGYGKRMYAVQISLGEVVLRLSRETGLNKVSAQHLVSNLQYMLEGRIYKRTMNAYATEHYLTKITEDFSSEKLRAALDAVSGHVAYYEQETGQKQRKISAVVSRVAANLSRTETLDDHLRKFYADVGASLEASKEERRARLEAADGMPGTQYVLSRVFLRNADVVAEVLLRAQGKCEACLAPAPFFRKHDGTPYLEVHHKKTLAQGGTDTIANAIALCPNCHRKAHYGQT